MVEVAIYATQNWDKLLFLQRFIISDNIMANQVGLTISDGPYIVFRHIFI